MTTRRAVLKGGAAALAMAGLGAAGAGSSSALAGKTEWERLQRRLTGRLVLPSSGDYDLAKQLHRTMFDGIRPAGVAYCETVGDVRACLSFAQHNGVPAVPRSGGHSYGGYSTTEGLVIDVSGLNTVQVGEHATVVGPGAQLTDLVDAAGAHGVGLASGICPTVAMGGYLQGGGIGWQTRSLGLGCDSLESVQVVLADGSVVTCSEHKHQELFWALRGGGGGNFGIVTRYERRNSTIPGMVNYTLAWDWDHVKDVVEGWQRWLPGAPREMSGRCLLGLLNAAPDATPLLITDGTFLGSPEDLDAHLDALVSAIGRAPAARDAQDLGFRDGMMSWFKCSDKTVAQCHRVGHNPEATLPRAGFQIDRSRLFKEAVPSSGVDEILAAFDAERRAGHIRFIHLFALGGAASDVPRTATAYVHRDARFSVDLATVLPPVMDNDEERAAARAWIDRAFTVTDQYSAHETYQNYIDPDLADWRQAYYAENYPRLVEAKRTYDPHGFFDFAQSIG
ncbi:MULTISPECIES: FAD-binding oxidoreductase [Streptomyces]|uniref:FAD-binding oxidoreductase n=1 Tax=Streptomyces TaxID=1883 RepID=UPI00240E8C76|nr:MULTISPECIES: FAD-binding oxidoreductase [Streptomyces]WFB81833.1 FAD-binding oxidoreductase [Streptomyces olivaceus]WGK44169.1 FAD-binding oxidoreductase [Streptomyces sp. B146]